jgi:hypothetical protein
MFQIPLVIAFVDRIKPLQPRKLLKYEKWVVIGSLVIAILAPFTYDFVTSLLIGVPIVVLYNLSILMIVFNHARSTTKYFSSVLATIAKPVENTELVVDDQMIDRLADELTALNRPVVLKPVPTALPKMDVCTGHFHHTETIKPPACIVERNAKRQALAGHVKVISDFRPVNHISHFPNPNPA